MSKSALQSLLREASKITASRKGGQKELAEYLGVPPQRVSEWVNGKRCPNGETTLKIQKWVNKNKLQ